MREYLFQVATTPTINQTPKAQPMPQQNPNQKTKTNQPTQKTKTKNTQTSNKKHIPIKATTKCRPKHNPNATPTPKTTITPLPPQHPQTKKKQKTTKTKKQTPRLTTTPAVYPYILYQNGKAECYAFFSAWLKLKTISTDLYSK